MDEKELTQLRTAHEGRPCPLCRFTAQAEEIEKAYKRWWPIQEIAEYFGYKRHVIKAHADAMGWTKFRAESTPEIYARLLDEMMENFDASELPQKELANLIVKISRWNDRLQGKVIDRREINENKSVVFLSVPLPGGAPPILPDKEAPKLLTPGTVEGSWEVTDDAKKPTF